MNGPPRESADPLVMGGARMSLALMVIGNRMGTHSASVRVPQIVLVPPRLCVRRLDIVLKGRRNVTMSYIGVNNAAFDCNGSGHGSAQ